MPQEKHPFLRLIEDPDYAGLPTQERIKIFREFVPDFAGLPPEEQGKFFFEFDPVMRQFQEMANVQQQMLEIGQLSRAATPQLPEQPQMRTVFRGHRVPVKQDFRTEVEALTGPGTLFESLQTPPKLSLKDLALAAAFGPLAFPFTETAKPLAGAPINLGAYVPETAPISKGVAEAGSALLSPTNVALLVGAGLPGQLLRGTRAAGPVQRLISGAFTADMAVGSAQNLEEMAVALELDDPATAARLAGHLAVNTAFATAAGVHALQPRQTLSAVRAKVDAKIENAIAARDLPKAAAWIRVAEQLPPPTPEIDAASVLKAPKQDAPTVRPPEAPATLPTPSPTVSVPEAAKPAAPPAAERPLTLERVQKAIGLLAEGREFTPGALDLLSGWTGKNFAKLSHIERVGALEELARGMRAERVGGAEKLPREPGMLPEPAIEAKQAELQALGVPADRATAEAAVRREQARQPKAEPAAPPEFVPTEGPLSMNRVYDTLEAFVRGEPVSYQDMLLARRWTGISEMTPAKAREWLGKPAAAESPKVPEAKTAKPPKPVSARPPEAAKPSIDAAMRRVVKAASPEDGKKRLSELREAVDDVARSATEQEREALASRYEQQAEKLRNQAKSTREAPVDQTQAESVKEVLGRGKLKVIEREGPEGETRQVMARDRGTGKPIVVTGVSAGKREVLNKLLGREMKEVKARLREGVAPEEIPAYLERLDKEIAEKTAILEDMVSKGIDVVGEGLPLVDEVAELRELRMEVTGTREQFAGKGKPVIEPTGEIHAPGKIPEMSGELARALIKEKPEPPKPGTVVARDSRLAQLGRKSNKTPEEWAEYNRLKDEAGIERALLTAPEGREAAKVRKPNQAVLDKKAAELELAASISEKVAARIRRASAAKQETASKTKVEGTATKVVPEVVPPKAPAPKPTDSAQAALQQLLDPKKPEPVVVPPGMNVKKLAPAGPSKSKPAAPAPERKLSLTEQMLADGIIGQETANRLYQRENAVNEEARGFIEDTARETWRGNPKMLLRGYARGLKTYAEALAQQDIGALAKALEAVRRDPEAGAMFLGKPSAEAVKAEAAKLAEDRERLGAIFRSPTATIIEQKMPKNSSAQQVRDILKQAPKAEVEVLQLESLLAGRDSVSRAEVQAWIAEKVPRVEVTEFSRSTTITTQIDTELRATQQEVAAGREQLNAVLRNEGASQATADTQISLALDLIGGLESGRTFADRLGRFVEDNPGFSRDAQILNAAIQRNPDLLARFERQMALEAREAELADQFGRGGPRYEQYSLPGGSNYRERVWREPAIKEEGVPGPPAGGYRSPHFESVPGYLWHDRIKDRQTTDGREVLFVEEIQSDRARDVESQISELQRRRREGGLEEFEQAGLEADIAEISFPFVKNWHELALKRLLWDAVVSGKDGIAWTTGQQQIDRYPGVQATVDRLAYTDLGDGRISLRGRQALLPDAPGTPDMVNKIWPKDKLIQNLEAVNGPAGRRVAEQILAGEGRKSETPAEMLTGIEEGPPGVQWGKKTDVSTVTFLDLQQPLKIGGSSHVALYDQMIPQYLTKLGKRFGVKPETVEVDATYDKGALDRMFPEDRGVDPQLAADLASRKKTTAVHFFPITPEMRMHIARNGFPLWGHGQGNAAPAAQMFGFLNPQQWRETFPNLARIHEKIPVVGPWVRRRQALRSLGAESLPIPADMGIVQRTVGSLSQFRQAGMAQKFGSWSKLPADVQENVSKFVDAISFYSDSILHSAGQARRVGRKTLAGISEKEWQEQVVPLRDNPNVTPERRPENIPDHIWKAYVESRAQSDSERIFLRDSLRLAEQWRLNPTGEPGRKMDEAVAKALERFPDDWGITEGYHRHAFPGDWAIEYKVGDTWRPVDIGWRAESEFDAINRAREFKQLNPTAEIRWYQDNIRLGYASVPSRQWLRGILKDIKEVTRREGADAEAFLAELEGKIGGAAWGPVRPTPKSGGPVMARESGLGGWAKTKDAYLMGMTEATRLGWLMQARPVLLHLRNRIAESLNVNRRAAGVEGAFDKPVSRLTEMPTEHASSLVAALDEAIQAIEGYPTRFQRAVQWAFDRSKLSRTYPQLPDKILALSMQLEAVAKLGLNPLSALLNLTQFLTHTYPVLGEKWSAVALAEMRHPSKYKKLFNDLAIHEQSTKAETEGFLEYFSLIGREFREHPFKTSVRTGYEIAMLPFQTAEGLIRRATAIGFYERARAGGADPKAATEEARAGVLRTMFNYSRWDKPLALRELPGPVGQFRTYTFKTFEFVAGLKPAEFARFALVFFSLYGISGFPGMQAADDLYKRVTGESLLLKMRTGGSRIADIIARGILPAVAGVDITSSGGLGDFLPQRAEDIGGPAASDLVRLTRILSTSPRTREREAAVAEFWAGLSPHIRRNMQIRGDALIDFRNGSTILDNLTEAEKLLLRTGLTPTRVAEERYQHRETGRVVEKYRQERGWFVDQIAIRQLDMIEGRGDARQLEREFDELIDQAIEAGYGKDLKQAIKRRMQEMEMQRSERELLRAPVPLREGIMDRIPPE